uniref:Solute carrier family 29 member 1 (Augustine blood group) n=1 Tax=Monodelphis domestica TaxID=13616 RepID=F7BS45_MONDO
MTTSHTPQDRYKGVWLIFFMLGLGTLLPWNFFMTASMYFKSCLGQPHNESGIMTKENMDVLDPTQSPMKASFLNSIFNVMSICAMLPLLIFTCLHSILYQRITQALPILGSLVAILLMFALTGNLVIVHLDPLPFFIVTMVKIVIINSFGAILQGSLFGLASLLPTNYTSPIMSGQGLARTFTAVAMICATASGSELEKSAFGYFITVCRIIVLSILCYLVLPKLKFYQYYQQVKTEALGERETKMDLIKRGENPIKSVQVEQGVTKPNPQNTNEKPSIIAILKEIWVLALSVCFVFTITMFPSVTAEVRQSIIAGTNNWKNYFTPVTCFLTFNIFDWAGWSLTSVFKWPQNDSHYLLPALVLSKIAFVPLLMQRPFKEEPACDLPPRCLVYRLHDVLCLLQWLPRQSLHVFWPQESEIF